MGALQSIAEEWKQASPGGKALAITAIIVVAGLGLYTATKNKGSSSTPNVSLLPIGSDTSSISSPSTPTTSVTNLLGTIRSKTSSKYDAGHSGIPLRSSSDSTSSDLVDIPFGSQVSIIGSAIYGALSPQGTSVWYKVSYNGKTGYVSAYDLPNVFPSSNGVGMGGNTIGAIQSAPNITILPYTGSYN